MPSLPAWFIPARPGTTSGLKVICVGLPRTGTASLSRALHVLGLGPIQHYASVMGIPEISRRWLRVWSKYFEGPGEMTVEDWNEVFDGYTTACDVPVCLIADELANNVYPEAKIIINYRDFDAWSASYMNTIYPEQNSWITWLVERWEGFKGPFKRPGVAIRMKVDDQSGDHLINRSRPDAAKRQLKKAYDQHYAWIDSRFPQSRTLKWRPEDGWEPLCKFLGVPVPTDSFPHVNDKATFVARQLKVAYILLGMSILEVSTLLTVMTAITLVAKGTAFAWWSNS